MASFVLTCYKCKETVQVAWAHLFYEDAARKYDGYSMRVELGIISPCCLVLCELPRELRDCIPTDVCLCNRHLSVGTAVGDQALRKHNERHAAAPRHAQAIPEFCFPYTRSSAWMVNFHNELRNEESRIAQLAEGTQQKAAATALQLANEEEEARIRSDAELAIRLSLEMDAPAAPVPQKTADRAPPAPDSRHRDPIYSDLVVFEDEFEVSCMGTSPLAHLECCTCRKMTKPHSVGLASVHLPQFHHPPVKMAHQLCDAVVYKCTECGAKQLFPSEMYSHLLELGVALPLHRPFAGPVTARRPVFDAPAQAPKNLFGTPAPTADSPSYGMTYAQCTVFGGTAPTRK